MNLKKRTKRKQWINNVGGLLLTGLVLGSAGTAFAETSANISGGEVAADGSWHGDGKVHITDGDSFTNDANVYSSVEYSAAMRVYMDGGVLGKNLYGGWSESYDAYSNRVEITGGTIRGDVYGSWTNTTEARGNMVVLGVAAEIGWDNNAGHLYGGYSAEGKANSNILEISGDVTYAFGGYGKLAANENKLFLRDGSTCYNVSGGWSESGSADRNEVTIEGTVTNLSRVYAGCGATSASHNVITIDNAKVLDNQLSGHITAGKVSSAKGRADYNKLTAVNSDIAIPVFGARRGDSTDDKCLSANYNEVTLDNCQIKSVYASYGADEAKGNKLVINNSKVTSNTVFSVVSNQRADYNTFIADNMFFANSGAAKVYGVQTAGDEANNNTMYLKHTDAKVVTGVRAEGTSGGFNASGNRLTITDSIVSELYGVSSGDARDNISIRNNELIVSNSRLDKLCLTATPGGTGQRTVENNTLRLVGKGGQYQDITGGSISVTNDVSGYVKATGLTANNNTLAVYGNSITVGNINGFNNIDFYLADTAQANGMIITGTTAEKMDLTDTVVEVKAVQSKLKEGDKIGLVKLTDNNATLLYTGNGQGTIFNGSLAAIGYKLAVEALPGSTAKNDLVMTVTAPDEDDFYYINGQAVNFLDEVETNKKNIVETQANAAALAAEGADFMIGQGAGQAKAAVRADAAAGGTGFAPFAATGGGSMRYQTGSYVDSRSWHGAIGMARQVGKLTYGIAAEYGQSNYDSYMDNGTHGSGKSKTAGGTLFAELRQDNGMYFDASLRAGRITSDYNAVLSGFLTSYSDSANYYGFSLGGGKEFKVGAKDTVDAYGRVYYTRVGSSDTCINDGTLGGTAAHFAAVNSTRLRLGARYLHNLTERSQLYVGLGWQYEFGGTARATIGDSAAPAPSLKGHSGLLELGYKVEADKNLTIDLNVSGWTGKQRGFTGGASFKWSF